MAIAKIACGIILVATGTACCEEWPETVDKINITRDFALQMAIRRNIDIKLESLSSAAAEIDVLRSHSIYDPVFNASSNGGISYVPGDPFSRTSTMTSSIGLSQYLFTGGTLAATTQTGFTAVETEPPGSAPTNWLSSVGLTFSQPLLKNAGREITNLGITLAEISLEDSMERFRGVNTDTALSVINSYNRVYTLQQILETRIAAMNSAQNLLIEIDKREQQGPLQGMERANAAYALAQRRRDLVDAERNIIDQEASLRYLIGLDAKTRIIPLDPPSDAELQETEEQAIQTALELRPELRELRLTLKATELQERIARHQTLPDLFFTVSGGLSGTSNTFENSYQQIGERASRFWTGGMVLNVPIGNTAAENDYRRSKIRTEQVKNQIESLSWRIRNDIEADFRALISARLQRQISGQARQFAVQRLEEYRKNNQLGTPTATLQDVINAENDLTAARNTQLEAAETFAAAIARLWRDMGVLLERQGLYPQKRPGKKLIASQSPSVRIVP
ncbi:TolC family protein [Pelotalea chapellei]|uniref:TolC family protein n=1 Tax=Pelotalea chapellei TaxID=44671 RepID=A0ABS5U964_9BACT|nr:TolC family protein [Pelotalea chapellei]MBT1072184.1 TolC family protein [Pelotalea chapellei]